MQLRFQTITKMILNVIVPEIGKKALYTNQYFTANVSNPQSEKWHKNHNLFENFEIMYHT